MPTIGSLSLMAPVEPKNLASPKEKMPPSRATSQYPLPVGVAAMPTIGWASALPAIEPKLPASPWAYTEPSAAAIQVPEPFALEAIDTTGDLVPTPMRPATAPKEWVSPPAAARRYQSVPATGTEVE